MVVVTDKCGFKYTGQYEVVVNGANLSLVASGRVKRGLGGVLQTPVVTAM